MEVHNVDSTVEDSHLTIGEEDVKYTSTSVNLSDVQSVTREKIETTHQIRKFSVVTEVLIALVVTFLGLGAFKVTGLYDGMNSAFGKVGLGSLIVGYFWVMFRHGLYSGQFQRE